MQYSKKIKGMWVSFLVATSIGYGVGGSIKEIQDEFELLNVEDDGETIELISELEDNRIGITPEEMNRFIKKLKNLVTIKGIIEQNWGFLSDQEILNNTNHNQEDINTKEAYCNQYEVLSKEIENDMRQLRKQVADFFSDSERNVDIDMLNRLQCNLTEDVSLLFETTKDFDRLLAARGWPPGGDVARMRN